MQKIVSLLQPTRAIRVLLTCVLGFMLLFTTACSNDLQSARPQNPPVQAGGSNNAYTKGMDTSTTNQRGYQKTDRASLPGMERLIANKDVKASTSDLLYPGSNATNVKDPDIGPIDQEEFERQARRVPEGAQKVIDRSDPNTKILEKTGEAFKDASEFITEGTKSNAHINR